MSTPNAILAAALTLALRGLRVFPLHYVIEGQCSCGVAGCKSPGKHPAGHLVPNGCKDATTDPARITEWWQSCPSANPGIATGLANGVFVIGPDGDQGLADLVALEQAHGPLPRTPTARTGGGGLHMYFRWPAEGTVVNRRNHRGLAIDVRGEGGLVVAPPGRNTDGPYRWEIAFGEVEVSEAPAWLLAWVRGKGESVFTATVPDVRQRAIYYMAKCPPAISGQGGHDRTFAVARAVVYGFGLGPDVGYQLLTEHYNPRCVPPWSEQELRHKCQDADTREFDKPRGWLLGSTASGQAGGNGKADPPQGSAEGRKSRTSGRRYRPLPPYQPFPSAALPEPLRAFTEQTAAALGCDPAYVALPVLAAVAGCIGNARRIRIKRSWSEPSVLWCGVVGESGTLKSPAQEVALAALEKVEARLAADRREMLRQYEGDRDRYKEKRREALKNNKELPLEPECPPERRVLVHDITIERLAELLADNPKGLLLAREELAGWLGSFARYRAKATVESSDLPYWLSIHGARSIRVDRKGGDRRTTYVPHAAVSVIGGIQPGTLARCLGPAYSEAGLTARLLLAMPPRRRKSWTEAEAAPETVKAYEDLLDKLLGLELVDDEQGPRPFDVKLDRDAKQRWITYYGEWAARQDAAHGDYAALLSKLEGACGRLALLHHVVSRVGQGEDDCDPVEVESIEAAITLVQWFAHEAARIYSTLEEEDGERDTRRLVEWVQRQGGRVTVKQLQNSNSRKYPTRDQAETALDGLVELELGRWEDGPIPERGGWQTRWFVLHPTTDSSDSRPAGHADPPKAAEDPSDSRSDSRFSASDSPASQEGESPPVQRTCNDSTAQPENRGSEESGVGCNGDEKFGGDQGPSPNHPPGRESDQESDNPPTPHPEEREEFEW
jgi:hypothetical protein